MATVISTFAKKGGVGKSTFTWNFAGYLSRLGKRVLMIDADHQASISQAILSPDVVERLPQERTVAALFDEVHEPDPANIVHQTTDKNILLAPASDLLQPYALPRPLETGALQFVFREFVAEVADELDYVLCDTPPDCANLLSWNCLMASQYVVTVIELEPFSAQSIVGTLRKLDEAMSNGNPRMCSAGFVVNNRKRISLHKGYEENLRNLYGEQVFQSVLQSRVAHSEATQTHQHIFDYDEACDAAKETASLCGEVLLKTSTVQRRAA